LNYSQLLGPRQAKSAKNQADKSGAGAETTPGFGESSAFSVPKALGIQGRHATGSGTGNGLAVHMILHITRGKNAWHTGHGRKAFQAALGHDVAVFKVRMALENLGIG